MSIAYEDTLFADWFRKNKLILLGGLLVIVAVQGYFTFAPRLQQASMEKSWSLYNSLFSEEEAGQDGLQNLNDRLARARQDDRIYPWFVFHMSNVALNANDAEALRVLRGELDQVDSDAVWQTPSGEQPLAGYLGTQIDERLASGSQELSNPPATEEIVEISLTDGNANSYTLVATLYPGVAPEACAAFLDAMEAGSLDEGLVSVAGQAYLTVPGMGDPDADPAEVLPLERAAGYMMLEGALATSPMPSTVEDPEPGSQGAASFQIQLAASPFLDGRRTVFGQVIEGMEPLLAAVQAGAAANTPVSLSLAGVQRQAN